MSDNTYNNYYATHTGYIQASQKSRQYQVKGIRYRVHSHITSILQWKDINTINVLEIWCGQWYFAQYCKEIGIQSYIWYDLDSSIVEFCQKILPEYNFYSTDIYEHLSQNHDTYDIVFMSHVFEHIPLDQMPTLIPWIYNALKPGWARINIMPNAWSLFMGTYGRYNDLTHIQLYTENSFGQILMQNGIPMSKIRHHNVYPANLLWVQSSIIKTLRSISTFLLRCVLSISGYPTTKTSTFEILTTVSR